MQKSNIIDIDAGNPHSLSEVICVKCVYRWLAIRPTQTPLKEIECPGCGHTNTVIETGQQLQLKGSNTLADGMELLIDESGLIIDIKSQ